MFDLTPARPDEPADAPPPRLSSAEPEPPRPGLALVLVAFGIAAELLVRDGPGIGFPLAAALGVGLLAIAARPRTQALPYLGVALLLTMFAAIRTSPVLHSLDMIAAAGFAVVGASYGRVGDPLRAGVRSYVDRGLALFGAAPGAAGLFLRPVAASLQRAERLRRLPRMLLLLIPVVGVFLTLFATADPVFAHLLRTPFTAASFEWLPSHVLLTAACAGPAALLVRYAGTRVPDPPWGSEIRRGVQLQRGEWIPLVVCVDALFAIFVAVQFSTFFGGSRHVLEEAGLTYATYARTGFGQMIAAASLTLLLVAAVWSWGVRERGSDRLAFALLAGALVLLAMIVLASAFRRLGLYEEAYGFTWMRLLVHTFILWLAAVLACVLAAIARRPGTWVVNAGVALGLVGLLALNALNPDAFVARRNLARLRATGKIDVLYLSNLSADAAPTLVEALPTLPEPERALLAGALACKRRELGPSGPWPTWSLDIARARDALAGANLGPC